MVRKSTAEQNEQANHSDRTKRKSFFSFFRYDWFARLLVPFRYGFSRPGTLRYEIFDIHVCKIFSVPCFLPDSLRNQNAWQKEMSAC